MPNPREFVKRAHERFVVREFLAALNRRQHASYIVIAESDPPEALIQTKRRTSWIEVVTAWWNQGEAHDLFSYATSGETHVPGNEGVLTNMTAEFCQNFAESVQKKLSKETYIPFRNKYGPGYLAVSVQFPFFDQDTLPHMRAAWHARSHTDLGCFRSVYLVHRIYHGYRVQLWRPGYA